jgi:hypothetical protein
MPDMQTKFVEANGLRFEVLEEGTGDRLALCLRRFPEHAISWRHQIPVLAGRSISADTAAPPGRRKSQTTLCTPCERCDGVDQCRKRQKVSC